MVKKSFMKRIFCVFLSLCIIFAIAFQCSLNSYAVIGIDDAIIIAGVCLDLLGLGITIHAVNEFVQSPNFSGFCDSINSSLNTQFGLVQSQGKLFVTTTKIGWGYLCNWVKSTFTGGNETKNISFPVLSSTPESLILFNGDQVPYNEFMSYPFFIYKSVNDNLYHAFYCNNADCGMLVHSTDVQIYCTGTGKVGSFILRNGSWVQGSLTNMMSGVTYKGVPGSIFNINFGSVHVNTNSFYLFRTIDIITSTQGVVDSNYNPTQTIPSGESSATITASSDAVHYPGAIEAPATNIKDGEKILVEVPSDMVVDNNGDLTLTNNGEVIGQAIEDTTVDSVKPKVLTGEIADSTVIDQIIADTPAEQITGNAQADIETANKFRLPKKFLEGFPFSIPYSVFVGIKSFVAEGQAPVFNIPFSIERLGISENVTIDLSSWNPVARLCRAFLSLVWVAGLAMACNKFIKR